MKQYGFVYIWMDTLTNRFYIGSHFGTETDGYVCSNRWLKSAYKKRRFDFKRRILYRHYESDLKKLQHEESKWLALIKDSELSTSANVIAGSNRYYNMKKTATGGNGDANKGKLKPRRPDKANVWKAITPCGEEIIVDRLDYFCKERGLSKPCLYDSYVRNTPKTRGRHKGWQLILLQSSTTKAPST